MSPVPPNPTPPFTCPICSKLISSRSHLTKHVNEIHSMLRPYRCTKCSMTFKQKGVLTQHIKAIHTARTLVPCELCGKMYASQFAKDTHLKCVHLKETQHPCPHQGCRVALSSAAQLKNHMESHLPREQRQTFNCLEKSCQKNFLSQFGMLTHYRVVHEGKGFQCPQCGKIQSTESKLKRHILNHGLQKNIPCPQCGKLFGLEGNMRNHLRTVHGDESTTRIWNCSKCSKRFKTKVEVGRHERTHLSKEDRQKLKIFPCSHCSKSFDSLSIVNLHIYRVHTSKNWKGVICLKCDKSFDNNAYLHHHNWYVHDRRGHKKCYFCGKMSGNINEHIGIHTREKPFKCPKCPKKFIRGSEIKGHVYSRHVKQEMKKVWKCEEGDGCSAIFRSRPGLRVHVQVKHKGILPFKCNFCSKRTSSFLNLESHIRVHHTKENPYRCSVKGCEYETRSATSLRIHMKKDTNHSNKHLNKCFFCSERNCKKGHFFDESTGEYSCPKCSKRIKERKHFVLHVKSHNPTQKRRCYFCSKLYSNMYQHLRIHFMEMGYSCSVCALEFRTPWQLRDHHKNKHIITTSRMSRRVHPCPISGCWRSYITAKELEKHVHRHANPNIVCDLCDFKAYSKLDLVQHKIMEHGEKKNKLHNCPCCSYVSQRKDALANHCRMLGQD